MYFSLPESSDHIPLLLNRIKLYEDHDAFRALINYFYPRLYRIAYAVVKNKMVAEEAISDVFMRLWQMRSRLDGIGDINKYLCVATKNNALVLLRKETKWQSAWADSIENLPGNQRQITDIAFNPENQYLTEELRERIDIAISNLPARCKEVFQLIKLEGLSYKAAASELSVETKTVENQLAIALKKISNELKPYLSDRKKHYVAVVTVIVLLLTYIALF